MQSQGEEPIVGGHEIGHRVESRSLRQGSLHGVAPPVILARKDSDPPRLGVRCFLALQALAELKVSSAKMSRGLGGDLTSFLLPMMGKAR